MGERKAWKRDCLTLQRSDLNVSSARPRRGARRASKKEGENLNKKKRDPDRGGGKRRSRC